jgi:exodeoxyribonuclease VII large subunit
MRDRNERSGGAAQPQFDFGPDAGGADELQPEGTFTVSQLADAINARLRAGFREGIWVRGEIQGWSSRGPHAYFSLADDQAESPAVVPVAFFAPQRERLRPLLERHRLVLGDGMKVRIHGYLDYYAPTGRLSLKMGGIDPRFTLGDLAMQRDQVLRRLVAAGLLDANKQRRLTMIPLRIGVVTSVGSAAWHDFEHELARSGVGFHLSVCDVRVQGDQAVPMIAAALATLGRRPLDAVVVIRGGGARNELAVFDAEEIAVAIARSPVPVLTGLGHEVDRSVADDAAHTAFKTPTACAQALVQAAVEFRRRADRAFEGVVDVAQQRLDGSERRLGDLAHRIARRTSAAVVRSDEGLVRRAERLRLVTHRPLAAAERRLERAGDRLRSRPRQVLDAETRHVDALAARARLLDPVVMLARGWSITRGADGNVLRAASAVAPGDRLVTEFSDGRVASTVTEQAP